MINAIQYSIDNSPQFGITVKKYTTESTERVKDKKKEYSF